MKTVNSLSAGKSSSYLAVHYPADYELFSLVCIDDYKCAPKDKGLTQYVNAKLEKYTPKYGEFIATAEDIQSLIAIRDLEQYLGREIIWVRGKSFDDVIDTGTQTRLPSWARRYCTEQMKLLPIFMWWFYNIGEKCKMRIGFRHDEFDRMMRFFNNSDPVNFSIPVACSTKGQKRQRHENFNWRHCEMPLVKDGVEKQDVDGFWKDKYVGKDTLFERRKKIEFPKISNCIHCFHKIREVLLLMAVLQPQNMRWGGSQEHKDMGTWLDSKEMYDDIMAEAATLTKEDIEYLIMKYAKSDGNSCDTGGCTD